MDGADPWQRAAAGRVAEEVERLGTMPGSVITGGRARLAADHHRDLARRFAGGG